MDNRSLVLFLSGMAAAGAAVIAVACSDQPKAKCTTGRGPFVGLYRVTSGPPDGCLDKVAPPLPGAPAPVPAPGETFDVQAYNPPNSERTNADLNKGLIAIQGTSLSNALGAHPDPDGAHKPYSQGDFTTAEPGGDNFCDVPTLTAGEQDLPYVPEVPPVPPPADAGPDAEGTPGTPAIPGQHIKYEWSKVRVYVTAAANGVQLIGDLKYTNNVNNGPDAGTTNCEATYHVTALFPAINCVWDSSEVVDGGPPVLDPEMCNPASGSESVAVPGFGSQTHFRGTGSGINPDLAVTCDPLLGMCVLAKEPPAFK